MSYVVLARKYRPAQLRADGRAGARGAGADATRCTQQRLHHAYLFTGTRGIGKTTVAHPGQEPELHRARRQGGITAEPCGVCQACTEIDADRYIDYIELDAASNRSIDEIRDLIERAAYKPGVGRFKVFMIDEAHQLTKDAFNALLKTLEEPPEYLKFVLATTDPEKMLPTVLSRCLQFNLRPMAPETVREHLAHVLRPRACPEPARCACWRAPRAARCATRCRSPTRPSPTAAAAGRGRGARDARQRSTAAMRARWCEALARATARRAGHRRRLRGLGLSAAGHAGGDGQLLQQMAVEQAVPGALDATTPTPKRARWPRCWRRRDAAALQHRAARPRRAGADERRVRRADDGAAALPGLPAGRRGAGAPVRAGPHRRPLRAPAPPAPCNCPPAIRGAARAVPRRRVAAATPARGRSRPQAPSALVARGRRPPVARAAGCRRRSRAAEPAPRRPHPSRVPRPAGDRAECSAPTADHAAGRPLARRWPALALIAAAAPSGGLVRELAWQAGLLGPSTKAARHLAPAVERESLRTRRCATSWPPALARAGRAAALELEPGARRHPGARDAAERQRRQAEAEAASIERPGGARTAGAVQDRAHRARLDQTPLNPATPIPEGTPP
jgi:DNA polymerase III subunit gamma/tau